LIASAKTSLEDDFRFSTLASEVLIRFQWSGLLPFSIRIELFWNGSAGAPELIAASQDCGALQQNEQRQTSSSAAP
jgi:hypothetical protein